MMPVHAMSGSGLEQFLAEARGSGWSILGTVGGQRVKGKEGGEKKEGREDEGQETKKPPVVNCHHYCAEGPTIVVLGKSCTIACTTTVGSE